MESFLTSIKTLTQHIQVAKTLDPVGFDLIQLASLSEEERSQIKKEVKDIKLIHCHEFWELTEEIYKRLMLPSIAQELQEYFIQVQEEVSSEIAFQYELHPWQEFQLKTSSGTAIHLTVQTAYAESQIQAFLNSLDINDSSWKAELYDFDYKFNFESEVEAIFRSLAFECWSKATSVTQSEVHASLTEANGGSYVYDLGTGKVSDSQ